MPSKMNPLGEERMRVLRDLVAGALEFTGVREVTSRYCYTGNEISEAQPRIVSVDFSLHHIAPENMAWNRGNIWMLPIWQGERGWEIESSGRMALHEPDSGSGWTYVDELADCEFELLCAVVTMK